MENQQGPTVWHRELAQCCVAAWMGGKFWGRAHACMLSHFCCVWLFVTPRTIAHQAPLSMWILQARILEWVTMPSSRGSSQPKDRTWASCIAGGFFNSWATREALYILNTFMLILLPISFLWKEPSTTVSSELVKTCPFKIKPSKDSEANLLISFFFFFLD